jgi:hypothetical protein
MEKIHGFLGLSCCLKNELLVTLQGLQPVRYVLRVIGARLSADAKVGA